MTTPLRTTLKRSHVAGLALAVAVVPLAAAPADAASKHRRHKTKRAIVTKTFTPKRATAKPAASPAAPAPPAPPAAAAPAVTSVISIGGYVFSNVTYAEAVELYAAAVAGAAPGYTPPPVSSVSVTVTVGGTVGNG